jgi:hypothetical protein
MRPKKLVTHTDVDFTIDDRGDQVVIIDDAGSQPNPLITLPDVDEYWDGHEIVVKLVTASGGTVTIDPQGASLIDGSATKTLTTNNASIRLLADYNAGTPQWRVI